MALSTIFREAADQPIAAGPVLDAHVLMELRCQLGDEVAGQILDAAVVDIRQAGWRCAAALGTTRTELIRQAAHTLAGVAETVGARCLAREARTLEIAAGRGGPLDPGTGEGLARSVTTTLAAIEREVGRWRCRG